MSIETITGCWLAVVVVAMACAWAYWRAKDSQRDILARIANCESALANLSSDLSELVKRSYPTLQWKMDTYQKTGQWPGGEILTAQKAEGLRIAEIEQWLADAGVTVAFDHHGYHITWEPFHEEANNIDVTGTWWAVPIGVSDAEAAERKAYVPTTLFGFDDVFNREKSKALCLVTLKCENAKRKMIALIETLASWGVGVR